MSVEMCGYLASVIDEQLAEGQAIATRLGAGEESARCVDGYDLVTERNRAGALSWMEGYCGEHPNHQIRALLNDWALEYASRGG